MTFELQEKMTFRQAVCAAASYLSARGINDADPDISLLMERASGLGKAAYFAVRDEEMPENARQRFAADVTARGERIPVQQILEEAWFYGRRFYVNSSVLIPRMDTETLVETALPYLEEKSSVLDLCTGSGCIILSLVKEAGVKGTGSDISAQALRVAARNAEALQAECAWLQSDLFAGIDGVFDMIVSNPPYIRTDVIAQLAEEVKAHEPVSALDGGADGLVFYRRIAKEAGAYLKEDGRLILEIGYDQGESVPQILEECGWRKTEVIRDLAGHTRVVCAVRS